MLDALYSLGQQGGMIYHLIPLVNWTLEIHLFSHCHADITSCHRNILGVCLGG